MRSAGDAVAQFPVVICQRGTQRPLWPWAKSVWWSACLACCFADSWHSSSLLLRGAVGSLSPLTLVFHWAQELRQSAAPSAAPNSERGGEFRRCSVFRTAGLPSGSKRVVKVFLVFKSSGTRKQWNTLFFYIDLYITLKQFQIFVWNDSTHKIGSGFEAASLNDDSPRISDQTRN